jgi:SAM-dependent methyltransferase
MMAGDIRAAVAAAVGILSGRTPFRTLQNRYLAGFAPRGARRVLDVGAKPEDMKSVYRFPGAELVYANLEPGGPSVLPLDCTKPFPADIERFDVVLMLNVLEHIYDAEAALRFARDGLTDGGRILVITPYLYPYHRAPVDIFRPGADWYAVAAQRCQLRIDAIDRLSTGLMGDAMSFVATACLYFPKATWLRPVFALAALLAGVVDGMVLAAARLAGGRGNAWHANPMGFAVVLSKRPDERGLGTETGDAADG